MEPAKPKRVKTGGRAAGTVNKATLQAREAIAAFVDGNAHKLANWLDRIERQDGPRAAYQCFMDVIEYHVPKLARHELTGAGGGPVQMQNVEMVIVDAQG